MSIISEKSLPNTYSTCRIPFSLLKSLYYEFVLDPWEVVRPCAKKSPRELICILSRKFCILEYITLLWMWFVDVALEVWWFLTRIEKVCQSRLQILIKDGAEQIFSSILVWWLRENLESYCVWFGPSFIRDKMRKESSSNQGNSGGKRGVDHWQSFPLSLYVFCNAKLFGHS